jgi:hypothetical protein
LVTLSSERASGVKLERGADMTAEMVVRTEPVCSLPPGCGIDAITADGHVVAFCHGEDGRITFFWDGSPGQPFDGLLKLRDESPAIFSSDDGAHLAYVGSRHGRTFVGRDGREDPPFEGFSRSVPPTFGGGGRHLAYGADVADGDYRLIVDGEPVGSEHLAPTAAVFSPDGERLAYMEMRGERRGQVECRIVLDGQAGEWFAGTRNAIGAMQFSPDSRRFAYLGIDGKGHARWTVDGVPQRFFNETASLSLHRLRGVGAVEPPLPAGFSPDSRRFAYFADVLEKGVAVIEDDVPGPLLKGVGMPAFSPDSRHLAYMAQTYAKTTALVLDGAMGPEWLAGNSSEPLFSADSRRVAVMLQREAGGLLRKRRLYSVAVDGRPYPEEPADDASLLPEFSPDGAHLAWWLQRGKDAVLVLDGVVRPGAIVLSDLQFDRAGRVVYAGAIGPSATVMIDGRPGPLADAVSRLATSADVFSHSAWRKAPAPFRLSADGAHVAWAGLFGDRVRPVFDDEVGPEFDAIVEVRLADDGTATWWVQRDETVLKVDRAPA